MSQESVTGDFAPPPHVDGIRRRLLTLIVGFYLAALLLLACLGHQAFIHKTVVIPLLLLLALVTNRFRAFTRDWLVLLSCVILFDALRGLIYSLVTYLEIPVYMGYAIEWERALLWGQTAPGLLQSWIGRGAAPGAFEKAMVVVHSTHFLYFLGFGYWLWHREPESFIKYRRAIVALMAIGLCSYLLVPTVPPWLAAELDALPAITHYTVLVYSVAVPHLHEAFDTNPIAAMPSLHAAFPSLCALIAWHHLRWRSWPFAAYALAVCFSVMALGEHYLVDVIAGALAALLAFLPCYAFEGRQAPHRESATTSEQQEEWTPRTPHPVLAAMLIIALTEGTWRSGVALRAPSWMNRDFALRELQHHPGYTGLYAGIEAAQQQRYREAIDHFERALPALDDPSDIGQLLSMSARSAYLIDDHERVVDILARATTPVAPQLHLIRGISLVELGRFSEGVRALQKYPHLSENPEAFYWHALARFRSGVAARDETAQAAQQLASATADPTAQSLGKRLRAALEEGAGPPAEARIGAAQP